MVAINIPTLTSLSLGVQYRTGKKAILVVSEMASSPAMASTDLNTQSTNKPVAITKTTTFPDVNAFKGEVNYLTGKRIILGFHDGKFNPSASIKRIMQSV
ncbi:S-layer homology domain-containing protein [Planococcus halocryophilus]|uniref:S-layer homology domain-containing protein n=1 Tax=Planococcus halocryophilus TaxID=1215089 RepID=UPI001F0D51E3|nr:S-layer homology domain-containing protein [Planococcus halocryophilus]MCH4826774.1 S-layer homology domain-containing protein [Planococcus halocryophilus]